LSLIKAATSLSDASGGQLTRLGCMASATLIRGSVALGGGDAEEFMEQRIGGCSSKRIGGPPNRVCGQIRLPRPRSRSE
jgi:hypothetical protein